MWQGRREMGIVGSDKADAGADHVLVIQEVVLDDEIEDKIKR